jgi:hypothetical protein
MSGTLAWITPISGAISGGHPDQGLPPGVPGAPDQGLPQPPQIWPPDSLPPLPPGTDLPPGIWPPTRPTVPSHPIVIRPPHAGHRPPLPPVHPGQGLPGTPPVPGQPPAPDQGLPEAPPEVDNTLPGLIWPPLPPGTGIAGKAIILIWVVGVGYRWLVVQGPDVWPPALPPIPQPK